MSIESQTCQVLGERLQGGIPRPLAVALSGGGDSLALTLVADAWARTRGRELVILTVDHRLRPASAAWTRRCAAVAERLGRPFRALAWEGDKPATGLPAAARAARHRLLADAARDAGARVVLMGHTADDVAEAWAMRAAGSTTPDPREWAPSPAWPEGRGVFVLRPMLRQRREELRAWLRARGESWIDDPANDDPRFARSRARAARPPPAAVDAADTAPLELVRLAEHFAGAITLDRRDLRRAPADEAARVLALACVCAGGGARRPPALRIARLAAALQGEADVVATLAGARIEGRGAHVEILREAGEFRRRPLPPLRLPVGREVVWDGRFAAVARRAGLTMQPLAGLVGRLPREEQAALRLCAPALRNGLPAVVYPDGRASAPILGFAAADVAVESLVRDRFEAAAGLVQREPA